MIKETDGERVEVSFSSTVNAGRQGGSDRLGDPALLPASSTLH
jgi:hypothetical protein